MIIFLIFFLWVCWHAFAFIAKWGNKIADWVEKENAWTAVSESTNTNSFSKEQNSQENISTYTNFIHRFTANIDRYLSFSERQNISEKCIQNASSQMQYNCSCYRAQTLRYLEELNSEFLQRESSRCNCLFSNILGLSLDKQQRDAILIDEDRHLIVAGAGSGKTLTIVGKVAYLVKRKNIPPEEILLLSFTRKSTEEMAARVSRQLGFQVNALTFHKLGRDIINNSTGNIPNVADENLLDKIINEYYEKAFASGTKRAKSLLCFLAYYLYVPADKQKFKSFGDFLNAERGSDLETLKSKCTERKNLSDKQAIYGEKMKSLEEVLIANFLFLNGVKYEYERPYPYKWYGHGTYKPDFYLPDYDIYLEHFGVDKEGKCRWLPYAEAKKYEKNIWEKERLHKNMGTTLLKTYSYYQSEGILLNKLKEILEEHGVKFHRVSKRTILKQMYLRQDRGLKEFNKLISSFIHLFKAQGYTLTDLNVWEKRYIGNKYLSERTKLFLTIVKDIYEEYEVALRRNDSIDFSDMITKATHILNTEHPVNLLNKYLNVPYKYIIIDEYQDMGKDRYNLIKAIIGLTKAKLICVGDDWQSIYRFTGSDISLFTSFDKYWGKHSVSRIEKTYRNSQDLIDVCGKFIMSNKNQITKSLISNKRIQASIKKIEYNKDNQVGCLEKILDDIYENSGRSNVFLLGRNNNDISFLRNAKQSNCIVFENSKGIKINYKKHPELDITFLTVHGAKGLEADNVVIVNCKNDSLGFPNKIADDPILQLLLSEPETYPYAEERRLMYVALTRTKNRTYLLIPEKYPSEFVIELDKLGISSLESVENHSKTIPQYTCACCGAPMEVRTRREDGRKFYGCSNYPRCKYILDIEDDTCSFSENSNEENSNASYNGTASDTYSKTSSKARTKQFVNLDIYRQVNLSLENIYSGCKIYVKDGNDKSILVKIPAGISTDKQIKIEKKGLTYGKSCGDLYINIIPLDHKLYHLHGSDLYLNWPIDDINTTYANVPLLDGTEIKIRVPHGIQNGKQVKISGQGINSHGSLFVTFIVSEKSQLLNTKLEEVRFVCLDVETTGLDCRNGDRICEIGFSESIGGHQISSQSMLINPQRAIPPFITTLTGISYEMVKDKPSFDMVIPQILSKIDNAILVCHNASFDMDFMKEEFKRNGLFFPENIIVDTLKLARQHADFPSNKLQEIAKYLNLPQTNTHRALADAQMTQQVLYYLLFLLQKKYNIRTLGELLNLQTPLKTTVKTTKITRKKKLRTDSVINKTTKKTTKTKIIKHRETSTISRGKST